MTGAAVRFPADGTFEVKEPPPIVRYRQGLELANNAGAANAVVHFTRFIEGQYR